MQIGDKEVMLAESAQISSKEVVIARSAPKITGVVLDTTSADVQKGSHSMVVVKSDNGNQLIDSSQARCDPQEALFSKEGLLLLHLCEDHECKDYLTIKRKRGGGAGGAAISILCSALRGRFFKTPMATILYFPT